MTEEITIRTIEEAMGYADACRAAYEREAAAHAETLRLLELERLLSKHGWEAWERNRFDSVPF